MSLSTNVFLDESPISESNQVVSSEGKNYWYEELVVPIRFYLNTQPANGSTVNVFFTKKGRHVTMTLPRITAGTPGADASFVCDAQSVPARFRPATNVGLTSIDQYFYVAPTRQEGGTGTGDNVGRAIIDKNGSMQVAKTAQGDPFLYAGAGSFNIYAHSVTYIAQSAYNHHSEL